MSELNKLQAEFDKNSGDFILSPGEYQGPLIVRHPCVIDGQMSTIWSEKGPVLIIDSDGVIIKNVRIEITDLPSNSMSSIAIQSNYPDTILEKVETNGKLSGFPGETGKLNFPVVIPLGSFAADIENTFSLDIIAPENAEIFCEMQDIFISSDRLQKGKNHLIIQTRALRDNTILYGEIFIQTLVIRRIYITGKAQNHAKNYHDFLVFSDEKQTSQPEKIALPDEWITPIVSDSSVKSVQRGERIFLESSLQSSRLKIAYQQQNITQEFEIDGYLFLLKSDGKVRGDDSLIFFGNPESRQKDIQVRTHNDGLPLVFLSLENMESWIDKIIICLSIYGEDPEQNFSLIESPIIRIFAEEKEIYRFELTELKMEKTVVALEIYRYKGNWKINFVGAGYRSNLRKLCEDYGLEVEP